jgi:6-phosphofructokinase 1
MQTWFTISIAVNVNVMKKRIAILTGGGHISTLNSGIAAIITNARKHGWEVIGALNGWQGMQEDHFVNLNLSQPQIERLACGGGTVIKSSRTKPVLTRVTENLRKRRIDAVIAMGGDDTLGAAAKLHEDFGIQIVGWPKTMDNDLSKTYFCLGYPSAVYTAAQCLRNSFDGAYSHNRIAIVTMFGRDTDWVVVGAGAYGHADVIIPAEKEYSLEDISMRIEDAYTQNAGCAVVAVAEGAKLRGLESHVQHEDIDQFGHYKLDPHHLVVSLGAAIRKLLKKRGKEIRCTLLSLTYQLRNGRPLEIDRRLAMDAGHYCVDLIAHNRGGEMATITLKHNQLRVDKAVPLQEAAVTRPIKGTGFFNYDTLSQTNDFFDYAQSFLGKPSKKPGYSFPLSPL